MPKFQHILSLHRLAMAYFGCFGHVVAFPDSSWLGLPPAERKSLCELSIDSRDILSEPFARFWSADNAQPELGVVKSILPGWAAGCFLLSPKTSEAQAVANFKKFLKEQKTSNPAMFASPEGGRGGPADKLRQLAAYRLLRTRSPKEAERHSKRHILGGLYHGETAWYRAQRECAETLRQRDELITEYLSRWGNA